MARQRRTLSQVQRLDEQDPARAERMLDDLVAYLRAAMPKMRDTSSTLAQEIELTRPYLDIVSTRPGDRLTYAIDVPEIIGDARLRPMMLLPLIQHAIASDLTANSQRRLGVTAGVASKRLRLTLSDHGSAFDPERDDASYKEIRERLRVIYDANASLA